jgi:hypothetical protein
MLERDITFAELYENWAATPSGCLARISEFSKVIAGTLDALTESQELIAEAGAVPARNGVLTAALKSPSARFTMRNTPRRTPWEIDELNRRFATCMARLRPGERELLADWIGGWMGVYTDFGEQ